MGPVPRTAVRVTLAAAVLLCVGLPLSAYLMNVVSNGTEVGWDIDRSAANVVGGRVTYYIDTDDVPDVTPEQFAAAVRAAVHAWEDIDGTRLAFVEDPSRPASAKKGTDRINRFGFDGGVTGAFTYAVAFRTFSKEKIVDADVVFNPDVHVNDGEAGGAGTPLPWTVATPGEVNTSDVQSVTAHEWGHCLGCDHIPLARSTMYFALPAGAIMTRSLDPDDQAGIRHRYPAANLDAGFGAIAGDVDIVGTPDERGVQVTAIDYATARPAASTFSLPDGSWRIEGLPPGVYRLVATPILTSKATGNVYNPYWKGSVTDLVPAMDLDVSGAFIPRIVSAGGTVAGPAFALSEPSSPPGEPDDTTGQARPLTMGGAGTGRIESTGDDDEFSFAGTAGQRVSIFVDAFHLGSDLDPRVTLFSPLGVQLRDNRDIRSGLGSFDEEGFDLDARITDFTLPLTGTYTVRVRSDVVFPADVDPEDQFYVLTLLPADGTPSAQSSELRLTPAVLDGDGAAQAQVFFRPKSLTGGDAGPGLDVSMALVADGDADGTLSSVTDGGDGTYTAALTAAAGPGTDVVRVLIDGAPFMTVTATYRGPAVASRSDFSVTPPRVRAGGGSAILRIVPRDVNGVPHGTGRTVAFSVQGPPSDVQISGASDHGDGSYTATFSSGAERTSLTLDASVDGDSIGASLPVGVGFPLATVLAETLDALDDLLAASPPVKSIAKLEKARAFLAAAAPLVPAKDVLNGVRMAVKQCEAAAKSGADTPVAIHLLVEAAREAASDAIAVAAERADLPPEQKALTKAGALFDKGEALLAVPKASTAATKFRAALIQAEKVQ